MQEPVDLAALFEQIDFEDEDILNASKIQSNLFLQAGRLYIQSMRKRVAAEAKLKMLTSRYSLRIRKELSEDASGGRVTEGHVAARLMRKPRILEATRKFDMRREHEEFCKLLLESFRMRRDTLKIVGNLIGAEVYIARENSGHQALKDVKDKLRKRYPREEE